MTLRIKPNHISNIVVRNPQRISTTCLLVVKVPVEIVLIVLTHLHHLRLQLGYLCIRDPTPVDNEEHYRRALYCVESRILSVRISGTLWGSKHAMRGFWAPQPI